MYHLIEKLHVSFIMTLILAGGAFAQDVPLFYRSRVEDVERVVRSVNKGSVKLETMSAGGRPVYSVSYGEPDPYTRTANFNSASQSRHPEAFARRAAGSKPVFVVVSGIHGGELEGTVGSLNLIQILETGKDFRGRAWPEIVERASKYRLVIMPCTNPDGRDRVVRNSLVGEPLDTMRYYNQGTTADGKFYGYPWAKEFQPMVRNVGFLGGWFNDQGVNCQMDSPFEPMAEETKAILRLVRNEAPDCIVNIHSHEEGGEFLISNFVPPAMRRRNYEINERYRKVMRTEGVPPCHFERRVEDSQGQWAMSLTDFMYHLTGALSMTFEGPHGLSGIPEIQIGHDGILDTHLIMYRELLRIGLESGGFRGKPGVPRGHWKE